MEKGVLNAPEVQPEGEVEFREEIRMLRQFITNKHRKKGGDREEYTDISRVLEDEYSKFHWFKR